MDPDQALREAVEHINANELEAAIARLEDVLEWQRRRGFAPTVKFEEVH